MGKITLRTISYSYLNMHLSNYSVTSWEMKTYVHIKISKKMFKASFNTWNWKQSIGPSAGKWII